MRETSEKETDRGKNRNKLIEQDGNIITVFKDRSVVDIFGLEWQDVLESLDESEQKL